MLDSHIQILHQICILLVTREQVMSHKVDFLFFNSNKYGLTIILYTHCTGLSMMSIICSFA